MYLSDQRNEEALSQVLKNKRRHELLIRCFDIVAALLAILLFSPLMFLVALCIKLENPRGAVIFKQERIGLGGQKFFMYKFRSMHLDAEKKLQTLLLDNEMNGPIFKMKQDPRITIVGKVIRKLSLDEFPQFMNVLRGEMSMVGPRPAIEREYQQYNFHHKKRLCVKPGCTGLWQVSGRNELSFEEMIHLDLQYIEKRSVWLNAKIMLLTFKEITFLGKGM